MTILLHWSDTHVGGRAGELAHLHRLVEYTLRHYAPATTAVAITGDCIHNGLAGELRLFIDALAPLQDAGHEVFIVPGNHDCAPNGLGKDPLSTARFDRVVGDFLGRSPGWPKVWHWQGWRIIGLASTAAAEWYGMARGGIGNAQLAALASYLMDDIPTIVLLHHHPFWRSIGLGLGDSEALLGILKKWGADVLLFGHRHQADTWKHHHGVGMVLASGKSTELRSGPSGLLERLMFWRTPDERWLQFSELTLQRGRVKRRKVKVVEATS